MKLGWFSDTYLPAMHGVTTSIRDFGEELTARGHEIYLYVPSCDREIDKGMRIYSCKSIDFKPYPGMRAGFAIQMKMPQLDLVHALSPANLGWYALKIAEKRNLPAVTTYHTLLAEYAHYITPFWLSLGRSIINGYLKIFLNRFNGVIAPSRAIADLIPDIRPPVEVLPSGVNLKRFQKVEGAKEKLNLRNHGRVFLSLCRLGYEKKIDIVVKAAKKAMNKDDVLVIVGKGPALDSLKQIAGKDERIIFTGYVPDEEVPTYYSAADFYIIASDTETQGLTTLEAMACGTPVIAANAMANPEQVKNNENGYLFRPNSIDDLARIFSTAQKTEKLINGGLKMAESLSVPKQTDRLEKYYEKFI